MGIFYNPPQPQQRARRVIPTGGGGPVTITGSFTANAVVKRNDQPGSFTANAVIKRTYQPYQAQVRADTPNAYWRLGEASGFPQDSSGGAHNATATGGTPTYGVAGALVRDGNTAITFNGTTNYFDVPDSSGLNFADVLTAECWFKLSDRTVGATQFVRRGGTGAYSFGYAGDAATGFNVANTVFLARTGTGAIASSTQTITDTTTWHHAVVTKNGSTVKIYIDGVEGTNVNNPQTLIDQSATLRIGANQGGSEFFEGTLDELALYNYALTQTQVSDHYRLGSTGSGPFYADAVLKKTVSSSFTANAVIKRTQFANELHGVSFASPSAFGFGADATETSYAESFTPGVSGFLSQVRYALTRDVGTLPVDTAEVELWTDSSAKPGAFIATIASVSPSSLSTTSATYFAATVAIPVVSGTQYWIVFRRSGAINAVAYSVPGYLPSVVAGGGYSVLDTGVWSTESSAASLYFVADVAFNFTANAVIKRTYQPYTAKVLADAPNAYWRLGEASGNPRDSVGTNNVNAVGGSPTYSVAGSLIRDGNTAMTFPASSGLQVPDATALDVGDVFSIEFWVKRAAGSISDGNVHGIFNKQSTGGFAPQVFIGGSNILTLWSGAVGNVQFGATITDTTTWHHAVVTKSGATIRWYLDGALTPDDPGTATTFTNTTSVLIIAGEGLTTNSLLGSLDELALYNYALTAAQVSDHYRLGTTSSGPFYADAVLGSGGPVTITGSFTANAVLKATRTGTFTANAVIKRTYQPYVSAVRSDGPLAYWRLGEASGATIAVDEYTTNPGTYVAGPTLGVAGALSGDTNKAVAFASASSQYVTVANNATFNVGTAAQSWEFWVKQASLGATYIIIDKGGGTVGTGSPQVRLNQNVSGDIEFRSAGLAILAHTAAVIADTTTFHHIVVTKSSGSSTGKIYLDGVDVTIADTASGFVNNTAALNFGRQDAAPFNYLNGTLDEVAFYNTELTATQVAAHFRDGPVVAIYADAVLKATRTGSFTANAVLKRTQTGSMTANAVIKSTVAGSFTANAVIKSTRTGSFTANAIVFRTQTGSTTANAVVKRNDQPGSFTANAVVRLTRTGTFTANATILRPQLGSFTANAVIKATVSGSFTANTVIFRTGLTGAFTANAAIKATVSGSTTANAVLKATRTGAFTANAVVKRTQTGSFTADAVFAAGQVTVTGSFTANAILRRTFAATFTANATILRAQVGAFTANAVVFRTGMTGSFTANAVVLRTQTGSFSANAVLKKTLSSSFTANAWVQITRTGTFTAAAVIKATIAGSFSANAVVKATISGSYTANAVVFRTGQTGSYTANAVILRTGQTGTFTANAVIKSTRTGSTTANAVIFRSGLTGTFTASAVLKATRAGSFTADAALVRTIVGSFTASALLRRTFTGAFSADAVLKATRTGSLTADALLRKTFTGSFTADAVLWRTQTGAFTANAVVKTTQTSSFSANAVLKATRLGAFTADAVTVVTGTGSFTANAVILRTQTGSFTGAAVITSTRTGSFTADAVIRASRAGSFTADATLLRIGTATFTADAYLSRTGHTYWVSPPNHTNMITTPTLVFLTTFTVFPMFFHIQLDTVPTFDSGDLLEWSSDLDQSGWEYWDGGAWQPHPPTGVPPAFAGNEARLTISTPLATGTWFQRVRTGA